MKQAIFISTLFWILLSCNSTDTTNIATDTATVKEQSDSTVSNAGRQLLIEDLKRLKSIFASQDKEKIADLFHFPLSDTIVRIYVNDRTFNKQLEKNGGNISRDMFIHFYLQVSESIQINDVNNLFQSINLEDLKRKDSLEYKALIKTEPCYHFYSIRTEKDLVTLTIGTDANKDYKSKSISKDELPGNASEICEHMLWWVFQFDGRQLHLKQIAGAG